MAPTPISILFVGEESAGVQTLKAIAGTNHKIVAVMTSPPSKAKGLLTVWEIAKDLGYETYPAKLVKDPAFAASAKTKDVDLILNVHSLFIINEKLLRAARIGAFNMHPGPLPQYAGLNCVSWAIHRGETTYGVTVHQMVPAIDAGPIVYQSFFAIEDNDTGISLSSKCVKAGVPLIMRLLETAAANPDAIPLVKQDLTKREYFGTEVPEDGQLNWSRPAREVINFVRACDYSIFPSPWGRPRADMGGHQVAIVKTAPTGEPAGKQPGSIGRVDDFGALVACADEWVLVHKVMVDGRIIKPIDILN